MRARLSASVTAILLFFSSWLLASRACRASFFNKKQIHTGRRTGNFWEHVLLVQTQRTQNLLNGLSRLQPSWLPWLFHTGNSKWGASKWKSGKQHTVLNNFWRSALFVNLLKPATYISLSFASWSVLSFFRSGLEINTFIEKPGSNSWPCNSRAFSAPVWRPQTVSQQHKQLATFDTPGTWIEHNKTALCFCIFYSATEYRKGSHTGHLIVRRFVKWLHSPHITEKLSNRCIVGRFGKVCDVEGRFPCQMHSYFFPMQSFFVLGQCSGDGILDVAEL